jgi:hypothetical protein
MFDCTGLLDLEEASSANDYCWELWKALSQPRSRVLAYFRAEKLRDCHGCFCATMLNVNFTSSFTFNPPPTAETGLIL